eukprot:TRINITY_DN124678_c0_g1_i1.p1 TRINITY_DN124678_c0_g1~~TRINITY_DN124678_c0_g1_i1.p1  ORF type:complete len:273 (+),score=52.94 TRINITY_DN124678_c0_g1_i1:65-883(+)
MEPAAAAVASGAQQSGCDELPRKRRRLRGKMKPWLLDMSLYPELRPISILEAARRQLGGAPQDGRETRVPESSGFATPVSSRRDSGQEPRSRLREGASAEKTPANAAACAQTCRPHGLAARRQTLVYGDIAGTAKPTADVAAFDAAAVPTAPGSAFLRLAGHCRPSMDIKRVVPLDRNEILVGRLPSAAAMLESTRAPQMVSRQHARLLREQTEGLPDYWFIEDTNSLNGILINGTMIPPGDPHRLHRGDLICFGCKMPIPEFEYVFDIIDE